MSENNNIISIVVPCYNEEDSIAPFYESIIAIAPELYPYTCELIFVNDGSKDKSLFEIKKLVKKNPAVYYLDFSRNFGKEAAILAGLQNARGEYVVLIDVDLQDPPHLLIEMLQLLETTDYDIVATRRRTRKGEPIVRSFFAHLFYIVMNKVSDVEIVDGARDFRMMRKYVVASALLLNERTRFSKGIFSWVGFHTKWLEYDNIERNNGTTKWSFMTLMRYALDGIIAFSTMLLGMLLFLGVVSCSAAMLIAFFSWVNIVIFAAVVRESLIIICVLLFLGGLQLIGMGILGEYIAKIHTEVKNRPLYIVREDNMPTK